MICRPKGRVVARRASFCGRRTQPVGRLAQKLGQRLVILRAAVAVVLAANRQAVVSHAAVPIVRFIAVAGKLAYNFDIGGARIVSSALLNRRLGR
jgi:hypothetical protein